METATSYPRARRWRRTSRLTPDTAPTDPRSPDAPPRAGSPPWLIPAIIGCLALPIGLLGIIFFGIIAAIAIPNLVAARERTRDVAARVELTAVMVAEEMYATENGTYTTSLAALEFPDDEEVTTTVILSADGLNYEVCSRHVDSAHAWRSGSATAEAIELAPGGC